MEEAEWKEGVEGKKKERREKEGTVGYGSMCGGIYDDGK